MNREAKISRKTSESSVELSINLDGTGKSEISTGVPFYDHMLTAFSKHSLIDLNVVATGDVEIDAHTRSRMLRLFWVRRLLRHSVTSRALVATETQLCRWTRR